MLRSERATTQPNRTDALDWAGGLTPVYLGGALRRTLEPRQPVYEPPPGRPAYDGPAPASGDGGETRAQPRRRNRRRRSGSDTAPCGPGIGRARIQWGAMLLPITLYVAFTVIATASLLLLVRHHYGLRPAVLSSLALLAFFAALGWWLVELIAASGLG